MLDPRFAASENRRTVRFPGDLAMLHQQPKLLASFATLLCLAVSAPLKAEIETIPAPHGDSSMAVGPKFVGSASCTAANCHGGADRARLTMGDPWSPVAYHVWIQNDPHARSYETLRSKESADMVKKLRLRPAHEEPKCLVCHAPVGNHPNLTISHRSTPADGVGCESCHGPAEHWLESHKLASWNSRSDAEKQSLGYNVLDDLSIRTQNCASCHVGAPGMEVNHDLIAAGHPRLMFEMSALHARLPKHWQRERESKSTLDAKLWTVGRAVAAGESLRLLESRAANPHAPWPEFADYDCYSCHHNLKDESWRQQEYLSAQVDKPGSLRWNGWNYHLLDIATDKSTDENSEYETLRKAMAKPLPDRDEVRSLANTWRNEIEAKAASLTAEPMDRFAVDAYLSLLSHPDVRGDDSWDFAAQRYLGLAAMHYSSVATRGNTRSAINSPAGSRLMNLRTLQELLQFDAPDEDSRYNSPRGWSTDRNQRARQEFNAIHGTVGG